MKAVQIQQYGGEDQLELVAVPKPVAGTGEVVVKIIATSLNPIDPKRASGTMRQEFPLQFPFFPGGDFSGVVDSIGAAVESLHVGDEVYGYSFKGGAYAEYLVIEADKVSPKPRTVSHI